MYFLHIYEFGNIETCQSHFKKEEGRRENSGWFEPNGGTLYAYMENHSIATCTTIIYILIKILKRLIIITKNLKNNKTKANFTYTYQKYR
jgi:hypothetical protein